MNQASNIKSGISINNHAGCLKPSSMLLVSPKPSRTDSDFKATVTDYAYYDYNIPSK